MLNSQRRRKEMAWKWWSEMKQRFSMQHGHWRSLMAETVYRQYGLGGTANLSCLQIALIYKNINWLQQKEAVGRAYSTSHKQMHKSWERRQTFGQIIASHIQILNYRVSQWRAKHWQGPQTTLPMVPVRVTRRAIVFREPGLDPVAIERINDDNSE